jgi:RNA 2',3'-cyclic 3'-phosphodiesterase
MIRTFVAVEIPPAVRQRAADLIEQCRQLGVDAKWVTPETMHVTLQFLGNVRENQIPMICRAVQRGVQDLPAFDVVCRGVGAFPTADRPRVLWIGIQQGRDQLIELQARVAQQLEDLGYRGESRRFEPHLTVGRLRADSASSPDIADFVAANADFDGAVFDVAEVLIFSSELHRTGPRHEVLGRAELRG